MANYDLSGYRFYSKPFNVNHGVQGFTNLYDVNAVYDSNGLGDLRTGAWRPLFPSDLAANVSVSGLNVSVGAVAITGNPQVQVSNFPGTFNSQLTGNPNITVSNPILAVSGVLNTFINAIAVTGAPVVTLTGNQNVNIINPILAVSGNLTASISSVAITGNPIVTLTGNQNTNIVNSLLSISGVVTSIAIPITSTPNSTPSGSNGLALAANSNRKKWFLQNVATGSSPLFVGMGAQSSTQSYNTILGPASNLWAGDGGVFIDDSNPFTGSIFVSGMNNINYIIWELS